MDNAIGQQISAHLEFLGYEIEDISTADYCTFYAKGVIARPSFTIRIRKDGLVLISSSIGTWGKNVLDSLEFHNLMHKANLQSIFCRWYASTNDGDGVTIIIKSWFFGYEKKSFGRVVESFSADWNKFIFNFGIFEHY